MVTHTSEFQIAKVALRLVQILTWLCKASILIKCRNKNNNNSPCDDELRGERFNLILRKHVYVRVMDLWREHQSLCVYFDGLHTGMRFVTSMRVAREDDPLTQQLYANADARTGESPRSLFRAGQVKLLQK